MVLKNPTFMPQIHMLKQTLVFLLFDAKCKKKKKKHQMITAENVFKTH